MRPLEDMLAKMRRNVGDGPRDATRGGCDESLRPGLHVFGERAYALPQGLFSARCRGDRDGDQAVTNSLTPALTPNVFSMASRSTEEQCTP
jgi:hypothetical protein